MNSEGFIKVNCTKCKAELQPKYNCDNCNPNGWRSVQKPPNDNGMYLTCGSDVYPIVLEYNIYKAVWLDLDEVMFGVTHWMPLPAKPDL